MAKSLYEQWVQKIKKAKKVSDKEARAYASKNKHRVALMLSSNWKKHFDEQKELERKTQYYLNQLTTDFT